MMISYLLFTASSYAASLSLSSLLCVLGGHTRSVKGLLALWISFGFASLEPTGDQRLGVEGGEGIIPGNRYQICCFWFLMSLSRELPLLSESIVHSGAFSGSGSNMVAHSRTGWSTYLLLYFILSPGFARLLYYIVDSLSDYDFLFESWRT